MRESFVAELCRIAAADERVVLLTGDLGYLALEPFVEAFPNRFFNCGVAEQNMVGVATGLADAGFIPFVYSIVTFAALRPYEFIRNGPVLHQLPVRIVGIGGGVEYGHNGPTHYGLEDIGVMRTLKGLEIYCPADGKQARSVLASTWNRPAPIYYRIGKNEKTVVSGLNGHFELSRASRLSDGKQAIILSTGAAASEAEDAARALEGVAHWTIASINPPPMEDLLEAVSTFDLIVTVESHSEVGGLGSLVAEVATSRRNSAKVVRLGLDGLKHGISGSQSCLQDQAGISARRIQTIIADELNSGN